jgi:hypothetical protein
MNTLNVTANVTEALAGNAVSTTVGPPPCQPFIRQTVTVGYWATFPAVWAATDAQACGLGATVHLQITNLKSGLVELDYPALPTTTFVDFEGSMVSYNTPYRVLVELRSSSRVLASSTTIRCQRRCSRGGKSMSSPPTDLSSFRRWIGGLHSNRIGVVPSAIVARRADCLARGLWRVGFTSFSSGECRP